MAKIIIIADEASMTIHTSILTSFVNVSMNKQENQYLHATFIQRPCSISNPFSTSQQWFDTRMMFKPLELSKWADVRVGIV